MSIPEMPEFWSPLHGLALLQLAIAAADGVIEDAEIGVMMSRLAKALDGDQAQARRVADEAYAFFQSSWQAGGAAGADEAVASQIAYLRAEYADNLDKLQVHVASLIAVAESSPGIHAAESAVIAQVMRVWGVGPGWRPSD